jgi:hypothetical protein
MARKKIKNNIPPPPAATASPEELSSYFEKYELNELETAGYVRDLTPEEQKDVDYLTEHCRARVEDRKSARTQLNLALSAEQLDQFTRYANKKHLPPSTLARAWLLERLDAELKQA